MKKILLSLTLFGVLVSSSFAKTYIVGVENISYYPNYTTVDGKYSSSAGKEILDAFSKHSGVKFKYKPYPVARLFTNFLKKKSKLDFKFPDSPFWKGDKKKSFCKKLGHDSDKNALGGISPKCIKYSKYAFQYIDGVMVKKENLGKGKNSLKKLGFIRGFTAWDYYKEIYVDKTIAGKEANDFQGLLKQISKNRIDGGYMSIAGGRYGASQIGLADKLVYDPALPATKSGYSLASHKHKDIVEKFDKFLVDKKDMLDEIRKKYKVYNIYKK